MPIVERTSAPRPARAPRTNSTSGSASSSVERDPLGVVGRAVGLVAQLAAGDRHPVHDADHVEPVPAGVCSGSGCRADPEEAVDRPASPVSSASSRRTPSAGSSPNSRPPPGSVQRRARRSRGDPARAGRHRRPRTRRRPRAGSAGRCRRPPAIAGHGPRSPARNRGSRARDAGTRSPITRPIVARMSSRSARCRAARSNSGGRARNDSTRRETRSLLANRSAHGALVGVERAGAGRRAGGVDRRRREPRGDEARWRPSPVNGSRNPAASPTTSQPGPARRATRLPRGLAPAIASVAAPVRHASGSPGSRRDRGQRPRRAIAAAPVRREPPPPGPAASTMPMLTRPPGTGAMPQYAAGEHDHPRVARPGRRSSSATCQRQPDPRGQRRRADDARGLRDDRPRPVGADDDRAPRIAAGLPRS